MTEQSGIASIAAKSCEQENNEEGPMVTITVNNVAVLFNTRCHLRLKEIARKGVNVEYNPYQNHVVMRLKKPTVSATVWSSGKIRCVGASSLEDALRGARRVARAISKLGFACHFTRYHVDNIQATCALPFRVNLNELCQERPGKMRYEPELNPGLDFEQFYDGRKTTAKIHWTGSVIVFGSTLESIGQIVEDIYNLALLHREMDAADVAASLHNQAQALPIGPRVTTTTVARQSPIVLGRRPASPPTSICGPSAPKQVRLTAYSGSEDIVVMGVPAAGTSSNSNDSLAEFLRIHRMDGDEEDEFADLDPHREQIGY